MKEHAPLRQKTTMRIGGTARYFADLRSKEDVEEAHRFAKTQHVPLFVLGGGSNTIFSDGEINALIVQIKNDAVTWDKDTVTVGAGKNLPTFVNECAETGHDLSALTGILGSVGGAIFGNAGQGPKGVWIDSFVESVTVFPGGQWKVLNRDECRFDYRSSVFKDAPSSLFISDDVPPPPTPPPDGGRGSRGGAIVIWEAKLRIPSGQPAHIREEIEKLLQRRIETQPHVKTAGSCFKAVGGTPAWQLIDAAKLRGERVGGVQIAEKHANFLLNTGDAKYADACAIVEKVKKEIPENLEVEMRFVERDGSIRF